MIGSADDPDSSSGWGAPPGAEGGVIRDVAGRDRDPGRDLHEELV